MRTIAGERVGVGERGRGQVQAKVGRAVLEQVEKFCAAERAVFVGNPTRLYSCR